MHCRFSLYAILVMPLLFQGCAEAAKTTGHPNWTCQELLSADPQTWGGNDDARALGCQMGIQSRLQQQKCDIEQSNRESRGLPGLEGPECRRYQEWMERKKAMFQRREVWILPP